MGGGWKDADLTDVKATDSSNHGKFAQLAEVAPELRAVLAHGISANPGASRLRLLKSYVPEEKSIVCGVRIVSSCA